MKTLSGFCVAVLLILPLTSSAQVNSGSDGHDGALNPTANLVINMADHPDGIYHYTSVNIPAGVTVSFIPNAANNPVVWLVQGNCNIAGVINLSGQGPQVGAGSRGGPGGFVGGNGGGAGGAPGAGLGPGGGAATPTQNWMAGNASFATLGNRYPAHTVYGTVQFTEQAAPGEVYGNQFLFPLIGGSGGGGFPGGMGGAGGGGALMVAASGEIVFDGGIQATGGSGGNETRGAGGGSGGAARLVASTLRGGGSVSVSGGQSYNYYGSAGSSAAGGGRVRLDAMNNTFIGNVYGGEVTRGFQPIIILPANQAVNLAIQTVAGVAVAINPAGQLTAPDVIVPAAQQNPVSIVVGCSNIPLGSEVIVDVKPANGPTVRAVGLNNIGTQANSTATVQVAMPRGGGTIQAKAVSGIQLAANDDPNAEHRSIAKTGWTADGERFKAVEVTAGLGTASQLVYLTESGKRYSVASR